jgi:choice-of-anchor B domain-containing protein
MKGNKVMSRITIWRSSTVLLLVGALIFFLNYPVRAQTNGVTLVRNFYQPHGQSADNPPLRFSGCWGYVAPDGREYAILGTYTGTAIIDITDSANVYEVVHIPGPTSIWREMRTWGTYAYVVSEGGGGTQIIDLSQLPDTAWRVTSFTYTSGSNSTSRAHTIEIFDGYMYLNGCANWSPGGIVMFNLNNPIAPVFEGVYTQRYVHDSYIRNDTIFAAAINSGGGVDVIDARVKSSPSVIARITYTGSGTHNTWVTKDRRYVISTDEVGSTQKNLKFWDLATLPTPPSSPSATYSFNPSDIVHNVTVRGNYAYVAWYTAGFVVVDISNPTFPLTAGWYDTYPGSSGSYNGVWAVYPFFPSGKIITSDMQTGLYIFRFSNLAPRRPVLLLSPVDFDTVRTSSLLFRWSSAANKLLDPHFYELAITGPNINTRIRADDTTYRLLSFANYQPGALYQWHILTRDEVTTVPSPDTFRFVYAPAVAAPLLVSPANGTEGLPESVTLIWRQASNAVTYRLQVAIDSLFSNLVRDTSGLTDTLYQMSSLANVTTFYWHVLGSHGGGSGPWSEKWKFSTAYSEPVQYDVNAGWNMVSLGLTVNDPRKSVLYTTAISEAFTFDPTQGYVVQDSIDNGIGYWLKFDIAQSVTVTGVPRVVDTVEVVSGWNLIGTIAVSVPVSSIIQIPPGIVQSSFYEYDGGYVSSDMLLPGKAYWVRTNAPGQLVLNGTSHFPYPLGTTIRKK